MKAKYGAATRGRYVQQKKTFPSSERIRMPAALLQVESRDGVEIGVTLTKLLFLNH